MATTPRAAPRPSELPPEPPPERQEGPPGAPAKKFKFPTAFTVLAAVLLLVWIASFFVPAGRYDTSASTGAPVPGTYHKLPSCSAVAAGDVALVVESPGEAGTAPADTQSAPGAKVSPKPGENCVQTALADHLQHASKS